jgi:dihydrofolate reductase
MRKLKLFIVASLDGKIATKDGSVDWLPDLGTDDYGFQEFYDSIDTIIMGYKAYDISLNLDDWCYGDKRTYVFSKNPLKFSTPHVELISEKPETFVKNLKTLSGKDIWLLGGGQIVAIMHDHGLIDEYTIAIVPIILGEGIELFPKIKKQLHLKLMNFRIYPNGLGLSYWMPELAAAHQ